MDSPWSTPTQSEIGEAEAALQAKSDLLFDGLNLSEFRELGDGEPSMEPNIDSDFMNNDNDFSHSGRNSRNKPKKSPRGQSKSPEKKTKPEPGRKKSLRRQQTKDGKQKKWFPTL